MTMTSADTTTATTANPSQRGIFDCDDAYRSPLPVDFQTVFASAA